MKSFAVDLDALLTVAAAILDSSGVLLGANAGFLRLLPGEGEPSIGDNVARFFIQPAFAALVAAADSQSDGYRGLMTIGDYDGKTRTLRGRAWRAGPRIRVLAEYDIADLERSLDVLTELNQESSVTTQALARENIARKRREVMIVEASLTDPLTGVGNRRRLDQALANEISRSERTGDRLSALMADLDHFKRINDTYGHDVGDKVLAAFGELLREHVRATDIATRFGGEEFVVLFPHTGREHALDTAERIRAAFAARHLEPLQDPVTASFGAAELMAGERAESLLQRLDSALYRAKHAGRNRVVAG